MNNVKNQTGGEYSWKQFGSSVALSIAVLAFISCESDRPQDPYVAVPDAGITVENVVLQPEDYIGKQVTVAGTVKETFGEQAFLIRGEKLVDDLLAVGADPYPDQPNDTFDYRLAPVKGVRVSGVVRRFDTTEIERETGVKLDAKQLADYIGKPVLVIKTLERSKI